jgi:hypothetical protein
MDSSLCNRDHPLHLTLYLLPRTLPGKDIWTLGPGLALDELPRMFPVKRSAQKKDSPDQRAR